MQPIPDNAAPDSNQASAQRNQATLFWTACFLGWCALVTLTASSLTALKSFPFRLSLPMALSLWSPYVLATPFALWVAGRYPLSQNTWRARIGVHLLACLLFAAVAETLFMGFARLLQPHVAAHLTVLMERGDIDAMMDDPMQVLSTPWDKVDSNYLMAMLRFMVFKMQFSLPLYWVLIGVAHSLSAMATLREREKQAAELAAHLSQAQLAELRTQLQPHFLFNTLNSIAALIPQNGKLATEMVINLSDLLRMTLRHPQRNDIRLSEELTLLKHYVDIQRLRFGDRLAFHVDVSEEALNGFVPPLLLQPLVENAIRHAVERSDQTETITVRAQVRDHHLELEVLNTFTSQPHEASSSPPSTGLGLTNTRSRLRVQFGTQHHFVAAPTPQGGFKVSISIPARFHSPSVSPTVHEN